MSPNLWALRDRHVIAKCHCDPMASPPWVHYWDHAGYMMRRFPKDTRSVLDVGIGSGWLGAAIGAVYGFKPSGVEAFSPYIKRAEEYYGGIYFGDVYQVLPLLRGRSYDVVCCLNTIEHFEAPFNILAELERVAQKAVFVSTINFFVPNLLWHGNEYQRHRSLVTANDMKKRGYHVRGCGVLADNFGRIGRILPRLDSAYLAWKYF